MARYQVPQFIEFESKVIGPFSVRQFAYMLGGIGGTYILYLLFGVFPGILFIIPLLVLSFSLAFVTWNGRKFIDVLSSAFSYVFKKKLYIWKKLDRKVVASEENKTSVADSFVAPSLSQSKLKDLAWSLDVKENVFSASKGGYVKGQTQ
jgi:PrgI family protein